MSSKVEKLPTKRTRSKAGCINCKKRKKKCDEIKPICTGCLKRGVTCHYKLTTFQEEEDDSTKIQTVNLNFLMDNDEGSCHGELYSELIWRTLDSESLYDHLMLPTELEIRLPFELSTRELKYFEYYCKEISPNLSILPQKFNHYSKLYIPIALKAKSVLLTLISWGCRVMNQNNLEYDSTTQDNYLEQIKSIIDTDNQNLNKEKFLSNFVSYMLLVSMETSFGDTTKWPIYFISCFNLLNKMPGNFQYLLQEFSTDGYLLAENFAYFDVLASQSNENGTFYPIQEYQDVFTNIGNNIHDPLQGCARPIVVLIGKIITLLVEYNTLKTTFDLPECDKIGLLHNIMTRADILEHEIRFCKPDLSALIGDKTQLEAHLTFYELYQIAAQIYLKLVIKKLPPIVPEVEVLNFSLKQDLEILISSELLQKNLAFPMLVLGISTTGQEDRKDVESIFQRLIQKTGYMCGYQKIWIVVQKIWHLNNNGTKNIDWFKVTSQLGWRLNLGR